MDPELKQRLVGTAVLFGLAVIFVPMVLDGPVTNPPAPRPTGVPLALPEPLPEPAPTTTAATDDEASAREAAQTPSARTAPAAASTDDGWAVQLGSFAAQGNADALADRIGDAGFDAFVQRVSVENGTMYRVRVGPLADRDAALALAERIGRQTGERAVVVPHP